MIDDIMAVWWKEWKEFLLQRGSVKSTVVSLLLMVVVFGVFLPMQTGRQWVTSPLSMLTWAWLPLFLVTGMIADSFAGERERHTLETLLASRLPDRAILFGKVAAAIDYSLTLTVIFLIVGLVTVNVTDWSGRLVFYPLSMVVGVLMFGILGAGLVAGIGVLVSLQASTVRQAAQSLSIGILLIVWLPLLVIQILPPLPPEVARFAYRILIMLDAKVVVSAVLLIVTLLDAVLLRVALARFRRARLILD